MKEALLLNEIAANRCLAQTENREWHIDSIGREMLANHIRDSVLRKWNRL